MIISLVHRRQQLPISSLQPARLVAQGRNLALQLPDVICMLLPELPEALLVSALLSLGYPEELLALLAQGIGRCARCHLPSRRGHRGVCDDQKSWA